MSQGIFGLPDSIFSSDIHDKTRFIRFILCMIKILQFIEIHLAFLAKLFFVSDRLVIEPGTKKPSKEEEKGRIILTDRRRQVKERKINGSPVHPRSHLAFFACGDNFLLKITSLIIAVKLNCMPISRMPTLSSSSRLV